MSTAWLDLRTADQDLVALDADDPRAPCRHRGDEVAEAVLQHASPVAQFRCRGRYDESEVIPARMVHGAQAGRYGPTGGDVDPVDGGDGGGATGLFERRNRSGQRLWRSIADHWETAVHHGSGQHLWSVWSRCRTPLGLSGPWRRWTPGHGLTCLTGHRRCDDRNESDSSLGQVLPPDRQGQRHSIPLPPQLPQGCGQTHQVGATRRVEEERRSTGGRPVLEHATHLPYVLAERQPRRLTVLRHLEEVRQLIDVHETCAGQGEREWCELNGRRHRASDQAPRQRSRQPASGPRIQSCRCSGRVLTSQYGQRPAWELAESRMPTRVHLREQRVTEGADCSREQSRLLRAPVELRAPLPKLGEHREPPSVRIDALLSGALIELSVHNPWLKGHIGPDVPSREHQSHPHEAVHSGEEQTWRTIGQDDCQLVRGPASDEACPEIAFFGHPRHPNTCSLWATSGQSNYLEVLGGGPAAVALRGVPGQVAPPTAADRARVWESRPRRRAHSRGRSTPRHHWEG